MYAEQQPQHRHADAEQGRQALLLTAEVQQQRGQRGTTGPAHHVASPIVGEAAIGGLHARESRAQQQRGRNGQQWHGQEHPAPAEMLHDQPAQRGADHGRHHPAGRERGEYLRAQVFGIAAADHHVQRDRDRARTQALQQAPGHQHAHAHRKAGQQQPQYEAGQAVPQRPGGPVAVGPASGQGHADHAGGQGAAEGQRIQAQAIEGLGHGRHGRRHRQGFEGMQRHQRHHADGGGAVARGQDRRIRRCTGVGGRKSGGHTSQMRAALVNWRRR